MTKKIFFLAAFFAAVMPLAITASSRTTNGNAGAEPTKTVRTAVLSPHSFQPTGRYSGFISGANETEISAKASGYITKLLREEGDSVRAGETLAIIDGQELSATVSASTRSLEALKATLRDTERYYDQKIDEAESSLEKVRRDQDDGNATEGSVDVANESVKSAKRLRDAEISRLRAEISSAEGSLLLSRIGAENLTVTAPFSGIITEKVVSIGSFVSPGTPLYSLSSDTEPEVIFSVPNTTARVIAKDSPVSVSLEKNGNPVTGTVFSISSATGNSTVRVRFDSSAAAALRLGTYVEADIATGEKREALFVPESAVRYEYDDPFVFVVRNDTAIKTPVALGGSDNGMREVISGLTKDTTIIVEGQHDLHNNEPVRIYDGA